MEFTIMTRQGMNFDISEADRNTLLGMLNNIQLIAINISNFGLNKRNIISIAPKEPNNEIGEGIYRLSTASGTTYLTPLNEGDSVSEVVSRVNDRQNEFVEVGDVIIQSRDFDFIAASA